MTILDESSVQAGGVDFECGGGLVGDLCVRGRKTWSRSTVLSAGGFSWATARFGGRGQHSGAQVI